MRRRVTRLEGQEPPGGESVEQRGDSRTEPAHQTPASFPGGSPLLDLGFDEQTGPLSPELGALFPESSCWNTTQVSGYT